MSDFTIELNTILPKPYNAIGYNYNFTTVDTATGKIDLTEIEGYVVK